MHQLNYSPHTDYTDTTPVCWLVCRLIQHMWSSKWQSDICAFYYAVLTLAVFMGPGAESFALLFLLGLFGSWKFTSSSLSLQWFYFFEDLECSNNTQIWGISWHVNGKFKICKGWCENRFFTCTDKSRPGPTSVPENLTGAEWTILWPVPGVDSAFEMHTHPSCGLDMTARHSPSSDINCHLESCVSCSAISMFSFK